MNNNEIQVSVCVVTYNQEKYIAECLGSLVTQQTNFKFEIIIGEDCSTDNTRAIVQQYVEKYPNLIVPVLHENNVGAVENIRQVYKKSQGKYIAHMDGDDMALPDKLQKQFDILEANPDCSICVHNMKAIDSESRYMKKGFPIVDEKKYKLLDIYLISFFIIHSSKMFVNKIEEYIDRLEVNTLDKEIHIEQAKQGDIYFIEEQLGAYRQFVGITYENNFVSSLVRERILFIYENFDENCFSDSEIEKIKEQYATILLSYSYLCAITIKDKELFERYVVKSWGIKKVGIKSYVFKLSILYPELFFILLDLRKRLRAS
ncbi:glycosyltransferase family 2 protein [Psychrobacter frigidicola]|uniref:glycosyltransferase family 2 protein n=1 Tax=Psychrobacter frigidicola TaxID=45611 RepID=UPI00191AC1DC|nr:glycosyltransferase family 2 protein [Psychrobacter frigidicola]